MAQVTLKQEDIDGFTPKQLNFFQQQLGVDNLTPGVYQYGNTATANNQATNNQMFGASGTNTQALSGGALNNITDYIPQAQTIINTLYGKTPEQQEREDRINTGMMFLNFFSKMAAEASKPGATGLGSASIAGADTARQYIASKEAERARKLKEKQGVVSLATQLYAKDKPTGAPKDYTVVDANQVNRALGTTYKQGQKATLSVNEFNKVPRGSLVGYEKATPKKLIPIYEIGTDNSKMVEEFGDDYETELGSGKYTTDKPKGLPSSGERDRKKLIDFGYNYQNLDDKQKTEYKMLYQQAVEGKPVTEEIDGEEVTRMRGGIDLRILKNLPVPEGYDVNKVISRKTRDFKPDQIQSTSYGIRMFTTDGIINQLLDDGYRPNLRDMVKNHKSILAGTGTTLQNPIARKYYAATSNFISALLRKESGAAIGEDEYERRVRELFPQVGDDANTIQLKKQLREREIQTFVKAGGDAFTVFHPDTVPFLSMTIDGKKYNKLNTKGFAKYLEEQTALTDGIIFKNKIKDKTVDELKAMLGSPDASIMFADYQLDVINELLEEKTGVNSNEW